MRLGRVVIDHTFAEAFAMKVVRLVITADNRRWAIEAARAMSGFATSVIACGCEVGIEKMIPAALTPDRRPGVRVALFAMSSKELQKQTVNRSGQCVMTCPTTALFAADETGDPVKLGATLRYFGDGYQIAKRIGRRRYWRIPVMDGEFLCQDKAFSRPAIGGGNFLILARSRSGALAAAGRAVRKMTNLGGVIMPFPGGVVRSGSKVGSKYPALIASTNENFCPTLKGQVTSGALSADIASVMEIVINGMDEAAIARAMDVGIRAACDGDGQEHVVRISAGNYGGKLGAYHFSLPKVLARDDGHMPTAGGNGGDIGRDSNDGGRG